MGRDYRFPSFCYRPELQIVFSFRHGNVDMATVPYEPTSVMRRKTTPSDQVASEMISDLVSFFEEQTTLSSNNDGEATTINLSLSRGN
jgi:hypothetical protein